MDIDEKILSAVREPLSQKEGVIPLFNVGQRIYVYHHKIYNSLMNVFHA